MAGLDSYIPDQKAPKKGTKKAESGTHSLPEEKRVSTGHKRSRIGEQQEYSEASSEGSDDSTEEEEVELEEREAEPEYGSETEREESDSEEVIERTVFEAPTPEESGVCTLISVNYSGAKAKALLKLYDNSTGKTIFWYDNTGHQPYCLTDLNVNGVLHSRVADYPRFDRDATREVEKFDLLHDEKICMTKVVAKDPLAIGGAGINIRNMLENSWEDNIRYHDNYTWDRGLIPGYTYQIRKGNLVRVDPELQLETVKGVFSKSKSSPDFLTTLDKWLPLFMSPVVDYRRVALDIEVAVEAMDRIPDPKRGANQVICASLVGSDGMKKVLLLRRDGVRSEGTAVHDSQSSDHSTPGASLTEENAQLEYFDDELDLLKEIFRCLLDYPIVLTFNGDNFDLPYLWKRARVLGMEKEEIPITLGREIALLPIGVHLDLYKFFHNHAIQIYAFGNSYREVALDAVSGAILDMRKLPIRGTVSELTYEELASYCLRDSVLTLRLTSHNSNMLMNLVTMIMRISRMSMEDATRQGVSRWIRSLFFYEHRARGCLIPRQQDIERMKGSSSTTAIIKGKKYQGALVMKPESRVYFDVIVLDFASLYPSIIAKWNLSYETVNCIHPSCKNNLIPGTSHWVCKKVTGIMALIIGLLRQVRVKWFKAMSKDPSLSKEEREWYKVVQQALKVFLNASYGVFGADIFPLYCLPLADSTAAIGRHIITETIKKAGDLGMNVVYGDTDSLFLFKPTKEQIGGLLDWADSTFGIDLEVDKRYTFVTFSGRKKNYLGVMDNGVVDIKGLMGKKRNTPVFIKSAFNEMTKVLKDVKNEKEFDAAKSKIKSIVQGCYTGLKARRFSLDELTFKVMLSRSVESYNKTTPQHVKAAKQLKEKDIDVRPGDIISFVKVQGSQGVKPVQLVRIDEVDVDKYVSHIESTFGQVLDALGIEFDDIVGIKRLDFFSR